MACGCESLQNKKAADDRPLLQIRLSDHNSDVDSLIMQGDGDGGDGDGDDACPNWHRLKWPTAS